MLEAKLRDSNLKGRKFRNEGMAIGTIRRLNGDIIPVSLLSRKIDKYFSANQGVSHVDVNFEGEIIKAKVIASEKHVLLHNTINIDFQELEE